MDNQEIANKIETVVREIIEPAAREEVAKARETYEAMTTQMRAINHWIRAHEDLHDKLGLTGVVTGHQTLQPPESDKWQELLEAANDVIASWTGPINECWIRLTNALEAVDPSHP